MSPLLPLITLTDLGDTFLFIGMAGVIVFTLLYGLRSRWFKYPEGRALFAKSLSLALVSGLAYAFAAFGDYPFRDWARLGVYSFFAVSSWWFVVALIRQQWRAGKKRDALEAEYREAVERERLHPPLPIASESEPLPVRLVRPKGAWRGWPFWRGR